METSALIKKDHQPLRAVSLVPTLMNHAAWSEVLTGPFYFLHLYIWIRPLFVKTEIQPWDTVLSSYGITPQTLLPISGWAVFHLVLSLQISAFEKQKSSHWKNNVCQICVREIFWQMWPVSCVTKLCITKTALRNWDLNLGFEKEMSCVTETPDYIIVSCQFYVIILDWMWNMFVRYFWITASDW